MIRLSKLLSILRFDLRTLFLVVPTTRPRGTSKIPVNVDFPVTRVKIYIDSPAVRGWNEIDAIAMVDTLGKRQWADKAYASSSFGRNRKLPKWYE